MTTKAPLRPVVMWREDIGAAWWLRVYVRLACGHEMHSAGRPAPPKRMRCLQCANGVPVDR
jgi:hypothetical protein